MGWQPDRVAARPTEDELAAAVLDLWPLARSLAGDEDAAADLVQDTYVRARGALASWRGDGPLGAWLSRILRNLAIDRGRRSRRELLVDDVEQLWHDDAYTVDDAAVVDRIADRDALEDALVRLPWDHRVAVVLHDVDGRTTKEIAELLDVSLPAAKQRLRRGRMMLVTALAAGEERRHRLEGVPLRCWDARRHVSEYLDGELTPEAAASVEAHLARCPTCPPLYAALVGVRDHLAGLRDPDSVVPTGLRERLSRSSRAGPAGRG